MSQAATGTSRQLQDAFQAFNQHSMLLETAYRELEGRVERLSTQLAAAQSERLLQLAEKERLANRLEKLLETLPGGVVVVDGEGVVRECNPVARELLGEPLLHQAWSAVTARCFAPRHDDAHDVTLHSGRRVSVSRRLLVSEPGHILLLNDVTETRALQDAVNRQQRLSAMGEMTARLAHQIRTPLSAAMLYASNLARVSLNADDQVRFADKILARLRHLERMANDMLIFARGGTQDEVLLNVSELLQNLQQAVEAAVHSAQAVWRLEDHSAGAVLLGNREALVGALSNLVNNALDVCAQQPDPDTARLCVRATLHDGIIRVSVEDNGPGIPDEIRERIFEPFFTTRAAGTGLGLAVVQAVVRAHRGTVNVHSGASGSRFVVEFPCASQHAALPSGATMQAKATSINPKNQSVRSAT